MNTPSYVMRICIRPNIFLCLIYVKAVNWARISLFLAHRPSNPSSNVAEYEESTQPEATQRPGWLMIYPASSI